MNVVWAFVMIAAWDTFTTKRGCMDTTHWGSPFVWASAVLMVTGPLFATPLRIGFLYFARILLWIAFVLSLGMFNLWYQDLLRLL